MQRRFIIILILISYLPLLVSVFCLSISNTLNGYDIMALYHERPSTIGHHPTFSSSTPVPRRFDAIGRWASRKSSAACQSFSRLRPSAPLEKAPLPTNAAPELIPDFFGIFVHFVQPMQQLSSTLLQNFGVSLFFGCFLPGCNDFYKWFAAKTFKLLLLQV